jgi:hypothetical protein
MKTAETGRKLDPITFNQVVLGSSPSALTSKIKGFCHFIFPAFSLGRLWEDRTGAAMFEDWDTSGFTDADWAVLNRIKRLLKTAA